MRRVRLRSRAQLLQGGRPMGICASAVALWFMAVALFLIGASIRAWFRSLRSGSIARRQTRMMRR
jgi:hypothetical protein